MRGAWRGQGEVCSQIRARRRGTSSRWRAAVICRPTGSPSLVRPAGTEIDGFQHRLASIVNGVAMAPPGGGPSAAKAGTAVVGVRSTSTSSKRSEEHTSELQSLMRTSYAVFCLKKIKHEAAELLYSKKKTSQITNK